MAAVMAKTYILERPISVLRWGKRFDAPGGRYTTSDRDMQRILDRYPGVTLISTEPETPAPCAGGEVAGTHSPAPPEVEVRTRPGLQLRERRPIGGRVADAE